MTGREVTALALVLTGFTMVMGVQTWRQRRSTGDTGIRRISGRPGTLSWWSGVLFPAAVVLAVAAPLLGGPVPPLLRPATWGIAGAVLAAVALTGAVVAQRRMGASWRVGVDPGERTGLVTGGLFARVRNPIYSCLLAAFTGQLLQVPTVVSAAALLALAAAASLQVRYIEEPYLAASQGPPYASYAERTGRFLPGIGTGLGGPGRDALAGGRRPPAGTAG